MTRGERAGARASERPGKKRERERGRERGREREREREGRGRGRASERERERRAESMSFMLLVPQSVLQHNTSTEPADRSIQSAVPVHERSTTLRQYKSHSTIPLRPYYYDHPPPASAGSPASCRPPQKEKNVSK
eukprot:585123-Rhodomonas_salina.2